MRGRVPDRDRRRGLVSFDPASPGRGVRAWRSSPPGRGGVAIIDLAADAEAALDAVITAISEDAAGRPSSLVHRRIAGVDDGIVARIDATHAQLMPHGGPLIVRDIAKALRGLGVTWLDAAPAGVRPEAADPIEAAMLDALSVASSPAAIPHLLAQPARHRRDDAPFSDREIAIGRRLDRLMRPVTIACIGAPNAGKSSLLNALHRSDMAIVSELPGTTRDRVSAALDLDGVVVEWLDTPGLRDSEDPIETAAIAAAMEAIRHAVLVIHLVAPDVEDAGLPEGLAPVEGVLRVRGKADLLGHRAACANEDEIDLRVSAVTGEGITAFASVVRNRIVRAEDLAFEGRWPFHG